MREVDDAIIRAEKDGIKVEWEQNKIDNQKELY